MNKTWKWILGIVLVLVVLAAVIILPIVFHNVFGWGDFQRAGFDRDFRMPMMGGGGFSHFGGGFMMIGMGLRFFLPLVVIGLLGYGAYRLGKRNATPVLPAAPVAPAQTCPKCGQVVQAGWNNCASCGKKL